MSSAVQQALSQSGEGSEALADSEIQNMIQSHVASMVAESVESKQTQKTNLEESAQVDAEQSVSTNIHSRCFSSQIRYQD